MFFSSKESAKGKKRKREEHQEQSSPENGSEPIVHPTVPKKSRTARILTPPSSAEGDFMSFWATGHGHPFSISSLPVEIIHHIFLMLPLTTAATLNRVCRHWKAIADDDSIWRTLFDRHFGCPPFLLASWKSRAAQAYRYIIIPLQIFR